MSTPLKRIVAAAMLSALIIPAAATTGLILTADAAFAKPGKGKGNSNGRGQQKQTTRTAHVNTGGQEKSNHGSIASQLKNMNAAHSFKNGQGYLNASADSNVGQIATFQTAALETLDAEAASSDAADALTAFIAGDPGYTADDINTQIGALDSASDTYADDLTALEGQLAEAQDYEDVMAQLQAAQDDGTVLDASDPVEALTYLEDGAADTLLDYEAAQETEDAALEVVTGGREISDEAMDYFLELLGL